MLNEDYIRLGLSALLVRGRRIWGDKHHTLDEIVVRLMVGVGDLARRARDGDPRAVAVRDGTGGVIYSDEVCPIGSCRRPRDHEGAHDQFGEACAYDAVDFHPPDNRELKKELGNVIFSTIRWIDDLGFDPLECLDLAIEAQEKFAKSGRPR